MFFIARIVAAMFTGSCGSYKTTRTALRIESGTSAELSAPLSAVRVIAPDAKCCPWRTEQTRCAKGSIQPKQRNRSGAKKGSLDYWSPGDETIDDHNYRNHQQEVDEASSHVYHEEPKNPKDEQNYRDRPKHDGILARSELHLARQEMSQARRTAQCFSERYGTADYARWQPASLS
jgi:hypothetical protein